MSDAEIIYDLATDIANCVLADNEGKRKIRVSIIQLATIAIEAQRRDMSTLGELKSMEKYSR